jgi:hypothetical protein
LGLPPRLEQRSVPIALYDLGWALGVAKRLAPDVDVSAAIETYASATAAWNADQLRILREAAIAAAHGKHTVDELIMRERAIVRAHDEALLAECDRALQDVERAMSAVHRRPVRAHARGRLLAGLALSLSLAAACESPRRPVNIDAEVGWVDAPACVDPNRKSEWNLESPTTCSCGDATVLLTFNERGEVTAIDAAAPPNQPPSAQLQSCLLNLLAGYCYPLHAGKMVGLHTCHAWIA